MERQCNLAEHFTILSSPNPDKYFVYFRNLDWGIVGLYNCYIFGQKSRYIRYPANHFTILRPPTPSIREFYVVPIRRSQYFQKISVARSVKMLLASLQIDQCSDPIKEGKKPRIYL